MGHHLKASTTTTTTKTASIILAVTLVIGSTMTVGLLLPTLSSLMLIQSAEATTTSQVPECFGGPATIVGTDNDDVIEGTEAAMSSLD